MFLDFLKRADRKSRSFPFYFHKKQKAQTEHKMTSAVLLCLRDKAEWRDGFGIQQKMTLFTSVDNINLPDNVFRFILFGVRRLEWTDQPGL